MTNWQNTEKKTSLWSDTCKILRAPIYMIYWILIADVFVRVLSAYSSIWWLYPSINELGKNSSFDLHQFSLIIISFDGWPQFAALFWNKLTREHSEDSPLLTLVVGSVYSFVTFVLGEIFGEVFRFICYIYTSYYLSECTYLIK